MKKNSTGVIIGTCFIVIGAYYMLSNFLNIKFDIFFDGWWTLFIIVPSLMNIIDKGIKPSNSTFLGVGITLFLYQQRIINSYYTRVIIISMVMIAIGIYFILQNFKKTNIKQNTYYNKDEYNNNNEYFNNTKETYHQTSKESPYDQTPNPIYTAVMSEIEVKNISQDFGGAKCNATMGSIEIDLREVTINRDITIDITSVMSGVEIKAPMNARIYLTKTAIAGSIECKANSLPDDANAPIVHFVCSAVMGSIEII